ncbi:hypothetical protein C8R44DRAFT_919290 [Mycena epipterygia]|nr:hypothetical protein C8R44DRAFT_919290 [Mycena epipterygia]
MSVIMRLLGFAPRRDSPSWDPLVLASDEEFQRDFRLPPVALPPQTTGSCTVSTEEIRNPKMFLSFTLTKIMEREKAALGWSFLSNSLAFLMEICKGREISKTSRFMNILLIILIENQHNIPGPAVLRFEPTSSSRPVNGLWFSSLMINLMSALGASLSKS